MLPPDLSVPGPRETEKPPRVKEDRKKPPVTKPLPPEPRIKEKSIPDLPVDIPAFVKVKEDVYSGQKPFSDALHWLKEKGFKTIVHVLSPDEDETTSRLKFEAKGFKYVPIKVSPKTLDRKQVDELNHIVSDATNYPIFVYDRDTSLTGGLWYLHFRIVDRMTDEQARAEASRIGFKEDEDGTHRQMWLAIQRFLQNQKPK